MKTLGIPIAALLFGASVALPISANAAAIGGPGLRTAAVDAGLPRDMTASGGSHTLSGGTVLVQYNEGGGGGGGGGGYAPQGGGGGGYAPQGGGGYNRPYNGNGGYAPQGGGGYNRPYNGNGGNSFNTGAAILGIMSAIARQHQLEEQQKQQRQYNIQLYNNQLQKRREQVEHQRKLDIEKAKLEEQRQEQLDDIKKQLNEERKARLNQPQPNTPQPNPSYSPQPNTPLPNPAYLPQPNGPAPTVENDPYHDGPHHDRVGDIVINIIPAPDNCPDNFQELRVGATVLYPRRTDFPANPSLCAGTTGKGCYLKVESTPATCGGSRQVCVERCPTPLPPMVVDTCSGGNCAPQINRACTGGNCEPQPQINRACTGGNCEPQPQINRACTGGNCGQQYEPSQKPTKQASLTVKSNDYVEPNHPKPTKEASLTVKSHDYFEPDHPKPTKEASLTVKSHDYFEPDHPKPTKEASLTVKADDYVELNHPKPTKKPELTVKAHDDEAHHATKPAGNTDIATHSGGELDTAEPFNPPAGGDQQTFFNPVQCPNLNLSGCGRAFQEQGRKEAEQKKKAEEERKQKEQEQEALDQDLDSKHCNKLGGVSMASLRNSTNYKGLIQCLTSDCKAPIDIRATSFNAPHTEIREGVTGLAAAVPDVGGMLSGVTKFLWKDPTSGAVFDQMKKYVNDLVPQMIEGAELTHLDNRVTGLKDFFAKYNRTKNLVQKGQQLTTLEGTLDTLERDFIDADQPEKALAYFVAFATLKLAVLREEYLHATEYYGNDVDHCGKRQDLNATVACFKEDAKQIKQRALEWRLNKIHVSRDKYVMGAGHIYWTGHKASAGDDFCDWHTPTYDHRDRDHGDDSTNIAFTQYNQRRDDVAKAFGNNLDLILEPLTHWAYVTEMAQRVVAGHPSKSGDQCKPQSADQSKCKLCDSSCLSGAFDANGSEP